MTQIILNKSPKEIYTHLKEFREMLDSVDRLISDLRGQAQFELPLAEFDKAREAAIVASKAVDFIMETYEEGTMDGHEAAEQTNIRMKRMSECKKEMMCALDKIMVINNPPKKRKKGGRRA